jgi:hypothetical protein
LIAESVNSRPGLGAGKKFGYPNEIRFLAAAFKNSIPQRSLWLGDVAIMLNGLKYRYGERVFCGNGQCKIYCVKGGMSFGKWGFSREVSAP